MDWQSWIGGALMAVGAFLVLTGAVGIVRMPDFYTRIHAAGKSDSAGQLLVLAGLLCHADTWDMAFKMLLLGLFILITAPTATHAITKAAQLAGLPPYTRSSEGDAERRDA